MTETTDTPMQSTRADNPPGRPVSVLTIGLVAQATGLSVHTLRWFEREGLFLRPIARNSTGRRIFEQSDVEWLTMCNRLRDSGMPIAQIRRLAELIKKGPGNEPERLRLLEAHEREIETQIEALRECREIIGYKVAYYREQVAAGTAVGVWSPSAESETSTM